MKTIVKKLMILKLGLAGLLLFSGLSFGAETISVDVIMTVQKLSVVRLDSGSKTLTVAQGRSTIADRMVYKNDGEINEDFAIKVVKTTGNWKLVSTQPGVEEYRLSALFHHWNLKPTTDEYKDDDILTDTNKTSSDSVFFNDQETHTKDADGKNDQAIADQKGKNVPLLGERSVYIKFDSPSSTSNGSGSAELSVTALPAL